MGSPDSPTTLRRSIAIPSQLAAAVEEVAPQKLCPECGWPETAEATGALWPLRVPHTSHSPDDDECPIHHQA